MHLEDRDHPYVLLVLVIPQYLESLAVLCVLVCRLFQADPVSNINVCFAIDLQIFILWCQKSINANLNNVDTLDPFSAKQTPAPQHPPQPLPQSLDAPHFLPSDPLRCPNAFDPAADDEDVPHLLLSSWL